MLNWLYILCGRINGAYFQPCPLAAVRFLSRQSFLFRSEMSQQSPLGSSVFKALGLPDAPQTPQEAQPEERLANDKNYESTFDTSATSELIDNVRLISNPSSPLIYDQPQDGDIDYSDHESDDDEPTSYDVRSNVFYRVCSGLIQFKTEMWICVRIWQSGFICMRLSSRIKYITAKMYLATWMN